jgi:hypothetical protein
VTHYTRADWNARPARSGPGALNPRKVVGLAFHWPAMSSPLTSPAAVMAALRSWQAYHMDGHGWSDVAYQVAVDQAGNRYELRGLAIQSGANGDAAVNETYGAVLLILAPGEKPSAAMVTEARQVVAEHRALFPKSTRLVGHGQIRPEPTACPGPAAQAAINAGTFEPSPDLTRGPLIDHAIRDARKDRRAAKGEQRRAALKAALDALRSLPSWAKR